MSAPGNEHTTSGTVRRAPHTLSGQGLLFALEDEARALRDELATASGGRAAKTLAKAGPLRVTLVLLRAGSTVEPEAAAGGATLQLLAGRLRLDADGSQLEVSPGDLIVLSENLRQPILAEQDALFLVTVAWPEGAGAWDQEAAAGRL
jgi:quercetin dioxygenase-like cupin family protein